jgi:glyoxylase-like metal-dependent hydrolase (beta-lactamase superfamily II)
MGVDASHTHEDVLAASGWPNALPREANRSLNRHESVAPWFEIYEVADGTYAILEPHHYEEVISYLILGDKRAVLFDAGMGIGDIRTEVERLTQLPVIVVNSHSHYDHIGGDHQFREVWAFDDPLEVARIEYGMPPRESMAFIPPGSYRCLPEGFDPAAYRIEPSQVTRRLHDADSIDLGGRTVSVLHTPGHSPGSICLLDGLHSILFTGDVLYPGTLYAHFEESDMTAYRSSLDRLAGRLEDVSFICPAHNEARTSVDLARRVSHAFAAIAAGKAVGKADHGTRVYAFHGFRVAVPADE